MYLSEFAVKYALDKLKSCHPFFGITYLACKKANLPVGEPVSISLSKVEEDYLQKYFKPISDSDYYFRAFRVSNKSQFWLKSDYPSSGSQATRTQTFQKAFIHKKKDSEWSWSVDYEEILLSHLDQYGYKLPALAFALWFLREEKLEKEESFEDLIENFFRTFNITERSLFDISVPKTVFTDQLFQEK